MFCFAEAALEGILTRLVFFSVKIPLNVQLLHDGRRVVDSPQADYLLARVGFSRGPLDEVFRRGGLSFVCRLITSLKH